MMIYQYTAAALASENKVLAHPASADSIPTSANQEDHVSMGAIAARHARDVLAGVERILAIELLVRGPGARPATGRRPRAGAGGGRRATPCARVRAVVAHLDDDREPGPGPRRRDRTSSTAARWWTSPADPAGAAISAGRSRRFCG